MTGSYMLIAFILGLWCIWSANRDVNSLGESLGFTLMAIVIKSLMEWSGVPNFDNLAMAQWGILFVYVVVCLELTDRFSSSMALNMTIAVASALGYFFLGQYVFSAAGAAMVNGWLS